MTSPTRRVISSLAGVALATLAVVAGVRAATIRSSGTPAAGVAGTVEANPPGTTSGPVRT